MHISKIIAAAVLASAISAPAFAGGRDDNGGNQQQGQGQEQHQGQAQGQIAAAGAKASNDTSVSQDGDKTDALALAIAPPSFTYSPGAAVGAEVVTSSYAIGFPLIGGGFGEQGSDLTPSGITALAAQLKTAQTDPFVMAATCASSLGNKALKSMGADCDERPTR